MADSGKRLLPLLLEIQKEVSVVTKNAKNPFFKSKYADYVNLQDTIFPPLNARGIVVLQPTVTIDGKNYVNTKLILAETGELTESFTQVVFKDGDAQAQGSGITYARRYGLMALLALAAEDDDAEQANGRGSKSNGGEQATAQDPTKPVITETNELFGKAVTYCKANGIKAEALRGSYTIDEKTMKKLQAAIDRAA